jgi:hypothetical protein
MSTSRPYRRLADAYTFAGFRPLARLQGMFGDPHARLVTLVRQGKKPCAAVAELSSVAGTTADTVARETCHAVAIAFTWISRCGVWTAAAVAG